MTREEWFQNPSNVGSLRQALESEALKLAVDVLQRENRKRLRLLGGAVERNLNADAAQFNEQAGFFRFLDELEKLATPPGAKMEDTKPGYLEPSPLDRLSTDEEAIKQELELQRKGL